MEKREFFLPFRQIPVYPDEGRVKPLPDAVSSVFNHEDALTVADLMSRYVSPATTRKTRDQTLGNISRFCTTVDRYRLFRQTVVDNLDLKQKRDEEDPKIRRLQEILSRIDKENKPSDYLNITMFFQEHGIATDAEYDQVREELQKAMRGAFVKGERNIVVLENPNADYGGRDFADGLKMFGSFRRAFAYEVLRGSRRIVEKKTGSKFPTPITIEEINKELAQLKIDNSPPNNGNMIDLQVEMAYGWARYEVLDELIEEGYDIDFVLEKGVKSDPKERKHDLSGYKRLMRALINHCKARNKVLLRQLENLGNDIDKLQSNTNVFVLLGELHKYIDGILPPKLAAVTTISVSEKRTIDPNIMSLMETLMAGQEVPESLWQEAYRIEQSLVKR